MATEWISRDCVVAALDMCAVLAHYDIRAGRGTSFRIHCPFHEDDRPSCSVNPGAKVFNCFACGEQGNVLDFIAGMEDLDPKAEFRAVLEKAIKIIGHNPTPEKSKRPAKREPKNANKKGTSSERSNTEAETAGAIENSGKKPVAKKSKKKPKLATTNEPDGSLELESNKVLEGPAFPLKLELKHPWLDAQLKRIGVSRAVAQEFGIGFETRSNALMAGRVCFPVHNCEGDLVAYAGRWASDECDEDGRFFGENGREQPRYRLPKGFHKQLELFNWHRVLEQYEDMSTVVLVEGFWSVLRLQAMTVPSIALMGLSISDAQIRLLLEGGIRSVIVMLDSDDEGWAAMETIVPRLASHFFTRSVLLPEGRKPDEVDHSVLAEVKALCAEPRSDMPKVSARVEVKGAGRPKLSSKKGTGAKTGRTKACPKSSDKQPPSKKRPSNETKRYALSCSNVTASMTWSGVHGA